MKLLPYTIILLLIIGGIISLFVSSSSSDPTENIAVASPTPAPLQTVQNAPQQDQILGEQSQQIPKVKTATIVTNKGEIEITLFPEAAPATVNNFAQKSMSGFYNNLTFHRVEGWVVQGGDPAGNGTGGGQMPTELNNNPFIRGSVGVARGGDIQISNDSQFFITKSDAPWLDGQYTNFGQVSEAGLTVVEQIEIGDKILSITVE